MKFRDRLQLFMRGRYGIDDFYNFLFKLYLILLVLNLFINSNILSVIELLIVVIIFYRLCITF